jgi:phage tail-like protein
MALTQVPSLSTPATDPLRNFKFQVTFRPTGGAPAITSYFMTCSGLSMTIDTIPYREGGFNVTPQKMAGQVDFGPLTFTKGVIVGPPGMQMGGQLMVTWVQMIFLVAQGTGTTSDTSDYKMKCEIAVLDHPVTSATASVKAAISCNRAWPTSLAYSDLDAGANQLFISQMTLAHEGFTPQIAPAYGAADALFPTM